MIRTLKRIAILLLASLFIAPIAHADLQGYDISNWQGTLNASIVPSDFVIVGTTWGVGGLHNPYLVDGINVAYTRQLDDALFAGKKIGLYHYARGNNPEEEARFFLKSAKPYVRRAILALDWEQQDNRAWGSRQWVYRWVREVQRQTGVNPIIYVQDSAYWQVAGIERDLNCGVWIAQYASMRPTGYQSRPWRIGTRGEAMRQYSSSGFLPNWGGRLDLDIFRGNRAAWDKYANPNNARVAQPQPKPQPKTQSNVLRETHSYVVKRGESLWSISQKLGVNMYKLYGFRSGNRNLIYAGEVLHW